MKHKWEVKVHANYFEEELFHVQAEDSGDACDQVAAILRTKHAADRDIMPNSLKIKAFTCSATLPYRG